MFKNIIPCFDSEVKEWGFEARILRWLTLLWLTVGLITLFSASYPVAEAEYGNGFHYFFRQLIWVAIGLTLFNKIVRAPLNDFLVISPFMFFIILGLIILTLIPGMGTTINGATRWLSVGPVLVQPSELLKPFLVIQSAKIFGQWNKVKFDKRLLWLIAFATVLAVILKQPNLSTTALCGISLWSIALASGIRLRYLSSMAVLGILTAAISISIHEYQFRRVTSFINPWKDPQGDGYQLVQSLIAIGSGGLSGAGFGLSQQKLFYLPIQYTDFIFSVYAEEFGFFGSIFLLCLLITYATFALMVAWKCKDRVSRLVAMGGMIFLVGQSILNIGVATGALPTTGLPFPLFSYGGSSVIASLVLAGLLVRVARESNEAEIVQFIKV